jgi:hypothetical protein
LIRLAQRLSLVWLAALLLVAAPGAAQSRRPLAVTVGGPSAQWRPGVRIDGLLRDRALREALQNGLPLRFQFRVELWRKADPFDQLAGVQQISRAMLRAPLGEGYTLEDGRVQRRYGTMERAEAALQAALQPTVRPETGGRFYYLVRLNVETLSESDMDELRHWLRGEARPAVTGRQPVGRAVEKGVRRFFVRMLGLPTRRYEARTPIFWVR